LWFVVAAAVIGYIVFKPYESACVHFQLKGFTCGCELLLLPMDWEPWTTYGGGGYWVNPGAGNKNFWQLGWLVQRDITKYLTLGTEIFYFSKNSDTGRDQTGYNIGGVLNLSGE
jgi:hypothetical protein